MRSGSPWFSPTWLATIATVAMGASMYVVALITQWEMFVFAVAGIAATELQLLRQRTPESDDEPEQVVASSPTALRLAAQRGRWW